MEDFVATLGQQIHGRRKTVRLYAALSHLDPAECAILTELLPEIKHKRLLDIGVGAGRTTGPLLEISRDYTAIDIAPEMAMKTQNRFGLDSVWCCDARDMRRFADSSFDFALFSWQGIDYVNYPERRRVLNEVARVLDSGGIFVFSSHNRNFRNLGKLPWQQEDFKFTPGLVKEMLKALFSLPRHARLKRHEVYETDYAIVNDNAESYSLLTCYVTIAAQIRELLQAGFSEVRAFDLEGKLVSVDYTSPWIYYVARKGRA
jgi:SAM-dependent methyltransferase